MRRGVAGQEKLADSWCVSYPVAQPGGAYSKRTYQVFVSIRCGAVAARDEEEEPQTRPGPCGLPKVFRCEGIVGRKWCSNLFFGCRRGLDSYNCYRCSRGVGVFGGGVANLVVVAFLLLSKFFCFFRGVQNPDEAIAGMRAFGESASGSSYATGASV